jgi:hypothetical protein
MNILQKNITQNMTKKTVFLANCTTDFQVDMALWLGKKDKSIRVTKILKIEIINTSNISNIGYSNYYYDNHH